MTRVAEKDTAITGVGMSDISRGAEKSALALTVEAALEAIADAGLARADIDGIATWPGERADGSGFSPVGCAALQDALRLEVGWYGGGGEAPGQYGAVFNAIGAISAGLCRNVLIFRTMYEATARKTAYANSLLREGQRQAPVKGFARHAWLDSHERRVRASSTRVMAAMLRRCRPWPRQGRPDGQITESRGRIEDGRNAVAGHAR